MPKKFIGENSKAVVARARKAAVKEAESAKKKQEIENQYWQDNDKQLVRKQQRKEGQELKKQEQLKKKAEAKALLEEEMNSLKIAKPPPATKLTRAQINSVAEKRTSESSINKIPTHIEIPLEENINRITFDGEIASTVDEAINILSNSNPMDDKHPEKRMKAAYTAFEEKVMPQLKAENPTLRLSQLKQLLRKEWMKSPENPLNQRLNTS